MNENYQEAMSPQATFPSLEAFKHWYEQEFVAPKVVGGPGIDLRSALARFYSENDNDHGLLACALNVWAKLQRDHEKVLTERCQEYEKAITAWSGEANEASARVATLSKCGEERERSLDGLERENQTLRLGATVQQQQLETARKEFGHDYDVACKKLDDQNAEIYKLRKEVERCRKGARITYGAKKLRAFGKK